jgi:RNA polymerase sigma factor (TIGR02999 family)
MTQLTDLLRRLHAGDERARDALFSTAYAELHRLALSRLRSRGQHLTLDATSLVHETYLRFVHAGELRAEDRRAFFGYAAQVMHSVIITTIRDRMTQKRGGGWSSITLSTQIADHLTSDEQTILKVHEALDVLKEADARLAQVAEMRYFGGYSEKEIAETLEVAERTVQRDWEKARRILAAALT